MMIKNTDTGVRLPEFDPGSTTYYYCDLRQII